MPLIPFFAGRRARRLLPLAVVLGSWALFAVVAHELREDRTQPDQGFPFDRPVLDWLHQHAGDGRCAAAGLLSDLSGPLWLAAYGALGLAVAALLGRRRWARLAFVAGGVGGTMALNLLAKYQFVRLRPALYAQVCGAAPLHLPDPSFPSGHTMAAVALAGVLVLSAPAGRWRGLAGAVGLAGALGVTWSRLYLAAHYPSDVLAGWLAASGWVGSLYLALRPSLGRPAPK